MAHSSMPQGITQGGSGGGGDSLTNLLGLPNMPESAGYANGDQPQVNLSQLDTESVPQNLHTNPDIARRLTQAILDSVRTAKSWYHGPDGMPIVHWDHLSWRFLTYDLPVATISENPDNGAIPQVERSVKKFKGDTERFAIGAQFSVSELQNLDSRDQGVSILKLVMSQLRGCALETIGAMVMRAFVGVEDFVRRQAVLENAYAHWKISDYFAHVRICRGAAARGEGGFRIMLDTIHDERQRLHLIPHTHMAIPATTRAALTQDNREANIGGPSGVARFEAGVEAMTTFHGLKLNVTDTFRKVDGAVAENVLCRTALSGEFYTSCPPGEESIAHEHDWRGMVLYDEGRDALCLLTPQELICHLSCFVGDALDKDTLNQTIDSFDNGEAVAKREFAPHWTPHPFIGFENNKFVVAEKWGQVTQFWYPRKTAEDGAPPRGAEPDAANGFEGELRGGPTAVQQLTTELRAALATTRTAPTGVGKDGGAAARPTPQSVFKIGTGLMEQVGRTFCRGVANAGDLHPHKLAHIGLNALLGAAGNLETQIYGVVAKPDEYHIPFGPGTLASSFVPLRVGQHPSELARTRPLTAAAPRRGAILIGPNASPDLFEDAEDGHGADTRYAESCTQLRSEASDFAAFGAPVTKTSVLELFNKSTKLTPFPFHFMVVRDNISRMMTSCVAYAREPGNVMMSGMKSMTSGDTSNMKANVTFEFNAGVVVHSPERVQILADVGYTGYNGGKNCAFVDFAHNDDGDPVEGGQIADWVIDSRAYRGDIVVSLLPLGHTGTMNYCSLSGAFDTRGYPAPVRLHGNPGTFPTQTFLWHKLQLATVDATRMPELGYTVPAQVNYNLIRGTSWRFEEKTDHTRIHTGSSTLDGGDWVGVSAVRLGREFTHDRLHAMRGRGC
jgi:hypothetical protein